MAKWFGKIGFAESVKIRPGVYENKIIEHEYYGDLLKNNRRLQSSNQLVDNITISNEISVLADPYANENFHSIRFVEFMGAKWKVNSIEVQYPRLLLSLGGIYNDE